MATKDICIISTYFIEGADHTPHVSLTLRLNTPVVRIAYNIKYKTKCNDPKYKTKCGVCLSFLPLFMHCKCFFLYTTKQKVCILVG